MQMTVLIQTRWHGFHAVNLAIRGRSASRSLMVLSTCVCAACSYSETMIEIFGEAGRSARSAVGHATLPFGVPIEVPPTLTHLPLI